MRSMKTVKIFFTLCNLNLKKLFIYRASFFISLLLMSVWILGYVILIEVIFYHTPSLAGWNKGEVLLILSFYYLIQNISDIFFKDNFENFGDSVRRGELDFKLVKPVPPRLLAFFWDMRFDHVAGLLITVTLFIYSFRNISTPLNPLFFLMGIAATALSLILYFSILSIIGTLTFWVERNETFNVLIFNVSQLSRYPRQIYRNLIGKILTFGIPLALIASLPAEVAVQFKNGYLPFFFIGITAVFYFFSRLFWHYGLRRYTSANL